MMAILATALVWVLGIIQYAIIIRAILSWIPISRENRFIRLVYTVTEPVLAPIRGMIERSSVGKNAVIDFSPIIAFLIISVVSWLIAGTFGVQTILF